MGFYRVTFIPWERFSSMVKTRCRRMTPSRVLGWCLEALQPHWDHEGVSLLVCWNAKTKESLRVSSFCYRIQQPWNYLWLPPLRDNNSPCTFSHRESVKATEFWALSHIFVTWVLNVLSSRHRTAYTLGGSLTVSSYSWSGYRSRNWHQVAWSLSSLWRNTWKGGRRQFCMKSGSSSLPAR